ncbi:type II toxin-antitoxin system PemK/MazF family toxin [uncultured Hymenobacter sp.]|uniref:type II toxin-antitoxin system PemK/MazF family toxin n=1 Tax=uncultured Hymenobacter sp. TaxID=170016 RepID=UPI0035C9BC20
MVGKLVLARLPQADDELKTRPALVLRQLRPFGDLLLCRVSSQLRQAVAGFDDIISPDDADFAGSGLRLASLIRVGYLGVVPELKIVGEMGAISAERYRRILQRLSDYFKP